MGDVIEFRPTTSSAKVRRTASDDATGECRILLFTGVRYERHTEVEAVAPVAEPPSGSKPRVGTRRRKKQA